MTDARTRLRVPVDQLLAPCDPATLPFKTTAEELRSLTSMMLEVSQFPATATVVQEHGRTADGEAIHVAARRH